MLLEAIRPYINLSIKPSFMNNFKEFILCLKLYYGDPDITGQAQHKLKALQQTTSALAYFGEFQQYITVLQWIDGDMIVDRAIDGLKPNPEDKCTQTGTYFVSLRDLMRFIIPLDDRLFEREQERKRETKDPSKSSICHGDANGEDRVGCQDCMQSTEDYIIVVQGEERYETRER